MEHEFTLAIKQILEAEFGEDSDTIFGLSPLVQYLNIKTKSATLGSKARGSFANLYAVYVLVEDYLKNGFDKRKDYSDYVGSKFIDLFQRQRELPFGSKLQNHALNSRMNEEFRKYFPQVEYVPILRNRKTNRYWINEHLLRITVGRKKYNLAKSIVAIIEKYVAAKREAFTRFIETSERLKEVEAEGDSQVENFIMGLLAPNMDARVFEIVSYAILKYFYHDQIVYFGFDLENIQ